MDLKRFYYRSMPVGHFVDLAGYPIAPGVYDYMPFRGPGHVEAYKASVDTGGVWCSFRNGRSEIRFRARVESFRVEVLEITDASTGRERAPIENSHMSFELKKWSIVPGPDAIRPPYLSVALDSIAQYPVQQVEAAVFRMPGVRLVHAATPDWWSWVARWTSQQGYIDLAMRLFDWNALEWGGFKLSGTGTPEALLSLYARLHAELPACWLHDDSCALHSAESFAVLMGIRDALGP